jgi:hypothetical protein
MAAKLAGSPDGEGVAARKGDGRRERRRGGRRRAEQAAKYNKDGRRTGVKKKASQRHDTNAATCAVRAEPGQRLAAKDFRDLYGPSSR